MESMDYSKELLRIMRERIKKVASQSDANSSAEAVHYVQERTKELACLYRVSRLLGDLNQPFENTLARIAELLPLSWQYPEVAHGRIIFRDIIVESPGFCEGICRQSAQIWVKGDAVGVVEVFYSEEKEQSDEGPFLVEERLLIDAIAENIGRTLTQKETLHSLSERVKELNCLHEFSEIVNKLGANVPAILQAVADLLPPSWQYPEVACARIVFEDSECVTGGYSKSSWSQRSKLEIDKEEVGFVEVSYLVEMPKSDEGPFLKEERLLIDTVSERLAKVIRRVRAERQLEAERESLRNMNIAMKEVIKHANEEGRRLVDQVQSNVDRVIMPILQACEQTATSDYAGYISLIRKNLEDIINPYVNRLSDKFANLTSTEIQVCNMIKNGLSTKDIAVLRRISVATVSRHREHIRRKLGIMNTDTNLATFLVSLKLAKGDVVN